MRRGAGSFSLTKGLRGLGAGFWFRNSSSTSGLLWKCWVWAKHCPPPPPPKWKFGHCGMARRARVLRATLVGLGFLSTRKIAGYFPLPPGFRTTLELSRCLMGKNEPVFWALLISNPWRSPKDLVSLPMSSPCIWVSLALAPTQPTAVRSRRVSSLSCGVFVCLVLIFMVLHRLKNTNVSGRPSCGGHRYRGSIGLSERWCPPWKPRCPVCQRCRCRFCSLPGISTWRGFLSFCVRSLSGFQVLCIS